MQYATEDDDDSSLKWRNKPHRDISRNPNGAYLDDEDDDGIFWVIMTWISTLKDASLWGRSSCTRGCACGCDCLRDIVYHSGCGHDEFGGTLAAQRIFPKLPQGFHSTTRNFPLLDMGYFEGSRKQKGRMSDRMQRDVTNSDVAECK